MCHSRPLPGPICSTAIASTNLANKALHSAHEIFHLSDGALKTDEHCPRDNAVADVVFHNLRDVGQPLHVSIVQAMSRIDADAQLESQFRRLADGIELDLLLFCALGIGV